MGRGGGDRDRDRARKRAPKDTGKRTKKKICIFCKEQIEWVDYKDVNLLRRFMSDRGKIRARRVSGLSTQNQRAVAHAIKLARELALLPYATRTVTERAPRPPRQARPEQQPDAAEVELDVPDEDDAVEEART